MILPQTIRERQAFVPPVRDEHVHQQVASGTAWSGLSLLGMTLIQLVRSAIFARLLMPEDFGVLSLANVFTQFILIFANFGFNASIIYQRDIDRKDLSTCWWSNLTVDGSLAVICVAVAFLGRELTGIDRGAWVVSLLALQFVATAVGSINLALMRRMFMFRQIAITKVTGAVATLLGALFFVAVLDWGIYGLVMGMVAGSVVMTGLNFYYLPWLPSGSFARDRLRHHLSYGGWFLGVNVVTYVNGNLDRTLVGTRLDTTQLGYYEYAANIPLTVALQLANAINSVLFPAISSLQDNLAQLGDLLRKVYRYNALMIYPLLAGMALVAEDFVLTLYGDKWMPVIPVLRVFCLVGMVRVVNNPLYPLCSGLGLPRLPFKWSLILLPVNLAVIWFGIGQWGLMGAAQARYVVPLLIMATLGRDIFRRAGFRWRWLFAAIWPAIFCCAVMAAGVLGLRLLDPVRDLPLLPRLLVQVAAGGACYVGALMAFFRDDVDALVAQGRRFLKHG